MVRRVRRRKEYWIFERARKLRREGFSEPEIDIMSRLKIGGPEVRKLRRARKKDVAALVGAGYTFEGAVMEMVNILRAKDRYIDTWYDFRRVVYPSMFVFPGRERVY